MLTFLELAHMVDATLFRTCTHRQSYAWSNTCTATCGGSTIETGGRTLSNSEKIAEVLQRTVGDAFVWEVS